MDGRCQHPPIPEVSQDEAEASLPEEGEGSKLNDVALTNVTEPDEREPSNQELLSQVITQVPRRQPIQGA